MTKGAECQFQRRRGRIAKEWPETLNSMTHHAGLEPGARAVKRQAVEACVGGERVHAPAKTRAVTAAVRAEPSSARGVTVSSKGEDTEVVRSGGETSSTTGSTTRRELLAETS